MRLKIVRAARMADAMAELRTALGPDAVILSTRRVAGGVELTAALEPDEPELILPGPPACLPAAPAAQRGPLAPHGVPPALAARLGTRPLAAALAETLHFGALPSAAPRPLLLAGPPGAGKTLTAAKLAARLLLAGKPPLLVTTDAERAGAAEQLAAFSRVLGLTLAVAAGPATLAKALAHRASGQTAILDTAGCDPFDPSQARGLLALARAAEADIVLVLPAGLDPGEAADLARAFAALGAAHLLPTRLDVARRLGGILAAAAAAPLALAEAGTGPGAADGLTPLTPAWLAARLGQRLGRSEDAAA